MFRPIVPARVSHCRDREPFRWFSRSGLRSPCPAPHTAATSFSLRSIPRIDRFTVEFHQPLRGIPDQFAQEIVRCAYAAPLAPRSHLTIALGDHVRKETLAN